MGCLRSICFPACHPGNAAWEEVHLGNSTAMTGPGFLMAQTWAGYLAQRQPSTATAAERSACTLANFARAAGYAAPLPGVPPLPSEPPLAPNGPAAALNPDTAAEAAAAAAPTAMAAADRKKRKTAAPGDALAPVGSKKAKGGTTAAAAPAGHSRLGRGAASLINKWQAVAKQVGGDAMVCWQ